MGCDIHAHVEVKLDGRWEHYSALTIPRDYGLFAKIAGVRNYEEASPVVPPRGLPDELSVITAYDAEYWKLDMHTPGWLTGQEAREVEIWFNQHRRVDVHPVRPWGYVFGSGFNHFSFPEDAKIHPRWTDVRIVFWFDN